MMPGSRRITRQQWAGIITIPAWMLATASSAVSMSRQHSAGLREYLAWALTIVGVGAFAVYARPRRASLPRIIIAIGVGLGANWTSSVLNTRHPLGLQYLAGGLIAADCIAAAVLAMPRGGGVSGRGRDDCDQPDELVAGRWRALRLVSRVMPPSAGRRWLAEADSLLWEMAAARRGAVIRGYLISAPRLVVVMWAREVSRRARPGPRRPG